VHIFIDSADIQTIEQALKTGYVYGVTTNPTLLQRANVRMQHVPSLAKQIIELGAHELHLQVYAEDSRQMLEDVARLVELDPRRVVIKIPATPAGFSAATLPFEVVQQLPESPRTMAAAAAFAAAVQSWQ
jgi:transaldolase